MAEKTIAAFGSWQSPIAIDALVAGRVGLGGPQWDVDGSIVWLEGRPEDGGRQTLVRRTDVDGARDISPPGMNVRTRVQEYGGAAHLVRSELVLVSDFATGRVHRVAPDRSSLPLTPDGPYRYADFALDPRRDRVFAVREDHSGEGEPENAIVTIDLTTGAVQVVAGGRDFYSAPRPSPDGTRLAFLAWDHPNMPWDGTELFVAALEADGVLGEPDRVAGSATDWIAQPRWSPDGILHFVAEPTGWMNLHRWVDGRTEPVTDLEVEFAYPDWIFGLRNYAFGPDGAILAIGRSRGADRLYRIVRGRAPEPIDLPFTELSAIDVRDDRAVFLAAGSRSFPAIVRLDLRHGTWAPVRASAAATFTGDAIAAPESIAFPTTGGRTAHGLFYRPTNPGFAGPPGERPPLIVTSHGGPTSQANSALSVLTQLFTSRGVAVLDVDYGGSTGYGRAYRRQLEGEWGVVDVDDCVSGARWLAERGDVDGERLAIRGGSASGYTTLCALTFRDVFAAGISYYGIGDLLAFARETHKFESRYLDRLIGPLPAAAETYAERSPNRHVDQIRGAVLILQGLEDRVVPPSEAERIVDALWERRVPHAYLPFEGEDHGFRRAETIVRAFAAELSFLAQVFEFEPADAIEPVEVVNADRLHEGPTASGDLAAG